MWRFIMSIYKKCITKTEKGNVFYINEDLKVQMDELVKYINANSCFPLPLLSEYQKDIVPAHNLFIPNFMSLDYYQDDWALFFSGYPTDENKPRLTTMELSSAQYNILGVSLNSAKEIVYEILTKAGFQQTKDDFHYGNNKFHNSLKNLNDEELKNAICYHSEHSEKIFFRKLDVGICIEFLDEKVFDMAINVESYYLGNRLY